MLYEGTAKVTTRRDNPMQDFFIGFAFILMVLSPCLVAIISGPTDETINS